MLAATLIASMPTVAQEPGSSWLFELPSLDGSRFVRAQDFSGPVLLNFWSRDCAPCVAELPLLQQFGNDHQDWAVLLVATDKPQDAMRFLNRHQITLPGLRGYTNTEAILRAAGHSGKSLPYSVALQNGKLCYRHTGMLQEADLLQLQAACTKN